jgi:hypothetical protein
MVVVTPLDKSSVYHQLHESHIERVVLSEGVFSLLVRRGPQDPRVLVSIPEGEIEDLGTMFSVVVHGGRTARIAVTQGAVLLRRPGLPPTRLGTGSIWEPASTEADAPQPIEAEIEAPPPPSAAPVTRPSATPAAVRSRHLVDDGHRAAPAPARASQPHNARALDEDDTYLGLIRAVRAHDKRSVLLLAADYVTRFPTGFRRQEVDRVISSFTRD